MRVALYIPHEKFASKAAFVAAFTIPPFNPSPDILMWGVRVFSAARVGATNMTDVDGRAIYVESFAYAVIGQPEPE